MGLRILITAGPTRERIDSVRYISNFSTGTFGYSIAQEAVKRKHRVTLISGPVALPPPKGSKIIRIESAGDLLKAAKTHIKSCDCLIMTAAVCDFSPRKVKKGKIKRSGNLTLNMRPTEDIFKKLTPFKKNKIFIGFALESGNLEKNAKRKLREKHLDLIVANKISKKSKPFGSFKTSVIIFGCGNTRKVMQNISKSKAAKKLLDMIEEIC